MGAYYTSVEIRQKIKDSIKRNSKELENEINLEEKYLFNEKNIYV